MVVSTRGMRNEVTPANEELLDEIFRFFERVRLKAPDATNAKDQNRPVGPKKILSLQTSHLRDWYVPRTVGNGRPNWMLETDNDEEQLHRHVAALHKLGIPTFLQEQPQPSLMKLFFSLEAYVVDNVIPTEEAARTTFWMTLKEGFVGFVLSGMAAAVIQVFGEAKSSNVVAVFDASGYSAVAARWKISMRVCFAEIHVSLATAKLVRDFVIKRVQEAWIDEPKEGWTIALEGIDRRTAKGSNAGVADANQGAPQSLWENVFDERAYYRGAHHRLVCCDVAQGLAEVVHGEQLEQRPLVRHGIFHLVATRTYRAEVSAVTDELSDHDIAKLGSTWTAAIEPTVFASERRSTKSSLAAPPAAVLAIGVDEKRGQQSASPVTSLADPNVWIIYHASDGAVYYHCEATKQTVWHVPPGAVLLAPHWKAYKTNDGAIYYNNLVTNQTTWHLPAGVTEDNLL